MKSFIRNMLPETNVCQPDTKTENGQVAFSTTSNPLLDMFFAVVRDTSVYKLSGLLNAAMAFDVQGTIALILHLRDCRGGKGEKLLGYTAMCWVQQRNNTLYLLNLPAYLNVASFKDLLQLSRLTHGGNELEIFAEYLRRDMADLKENKDTISLAAKWAPTENTHFKKEAVAIASALFVGDKNKMTRYRKECLTPLRAKLNVIERNLSLGLHDKIVFRQIPAKAHKSLRKAIAAKMPERYTSYLADLKSGKDTIKVGSEPHELVKAVTSAHDETIDAQWRELIAKITTTQRWGALCDVSGSMAGQPMEVAIALSLVIASITTGYFRGKVLTFETTPQLISINLEANLYDKVKQMAHLPWGGSTDLFAAFSLLLANATEHKLPASEMIETLFVFSDMQFNQAQRDNKWETTWSTINKMYTDAGYAAPKIVFWNLRDTVPSFPATDNTPGVSLVSGFSSDLLKLFLAGTDFTPVALMNAAIAKYRKQVVLTLEEFDRV